MPPTSRRRFGPGFLVAAAFIGPGTVTAASKAGAGFGFALLWAVLFAVVATIVLQEMTARLGVVTKKGLGENLRPTFPRKSARWPAIALVFAAILVGNSAYQAGNLTGAATGLNMVFPLNGWLAADPGETPQTRDEGKNVMKPDDAAPVPPRPSGGLPVPAARAIGQEVQRDAQTQAAPPPKPRASGEKIWAALIATAALGLLWTGHYRLIQNVLVVLVALMSVLFVTSAVLIAPGLLEILQGLFRPTIPDGALLTVVALVGTTIVPYNFFLHASAAAETWGDQPDRRAAIGRARVDALCSISIGGLITAAILITAAGALFGSGRSTESLAEIAQQLRPVLGPASVAVFSLGLMAAGLTSAITAPLAAAYATTGCFGWSSRVGDWRFRAIFTVVIAAGLVSVFVFQGTPAQLILFAQVANGLLLPLVAVFLLVVMNNRRLLGQYRNGWIANAVGGAVVLLVTGLALSQFYRIAMSLLGQ